MFLSIVTTLYQSESTILEFYTRISESAKSISGDNFEIIFVNDGSEDRSYSLAKGLCEEDSKVSLIDLSKNFGHHRSLMVGLEQALGDLVFLIDSDLEEQPEDLIRFYDELIQDSNIDAVFGVQSKRKGGFLENYLGSLFYKIYNFLTDSHQIPENTAITRLMRKRYVKALLLFQDKEIYFAPLATLTGFNQKSLKVDKKLKKTTTYSFSKRYHLFINAIFSNTSKPLYFMFYVGSLITAASFSYVFYLVTAYFFFGVQVSGWTSTIVSIWFFGGLIILFLGIISIYVNKIYVETRNRPNYIVKEFLEGRDRLSR